MELPIFINGEEKGTLRISRDGLYTVMEAELEGFSSELVRLWVHGENMGACLGVMQPWSDGLWLRRRLSRLELAASPNEPRYASDREEGLHNAAETAGEAEDAGGTEETPAPEGLTEDPTEAETTASEDPTPAMTDYSACPWPAEPPEEGLSWYARPDGSLVAFDGVSSLVALPARLRGKGPSGAERVIEGKKYLVFRY